MFKFKAAIHLGMLAINLYSHYNHSSVICNIECLPRNHSFYFVITDPPSVPVNVSSEVDTCNGIELTIEVASTSDIIIGYTLFDKATNHLLYQSHISILSNSTVTIVPSSLLTNHNGLYWIVVTASSTVNQSKDNNC